MIHNWVLNESHKMTFNHGKYKLTCVIPNIRLYKGSYFLNAFLGDNRGKELIDFIPNIACFEITMTGLDPGHSYGWQDNSCIYREEYSWNINKLDIHGSN